jgi:micrococcal nuclease
MPTITVDEDRLRTLLEDLGAELNKGASINDIVFDLKKEESPEDHLYWYRAFVCSVYDGDTLRADWDMGANVLATNEPFRFLGINAPEKRGATKERGIIVRDYLRDLVLDKEIIINTKKDKKGKYGRYLATVHVQQDGTWMNVNQHLTEKFEDVVPFLR